MTKKIKVIRVGVMIIVMIAVIIFLLSRKSKGTYTNFIDQVNETNSSLIDNNGESVTFDEYTITLERTVYDQATGIGYLEFAITKENEKPELDLSKDNKDAIGSFGKNNRFCINVNGDSSNLFVCKENTLYEYIQFELDAPEDMRVFLKDNEQIDEQNDCPMTYDFTVKDTVNSIDFTIDQDNILTISNLGITINTNENLINTSIFLHYKNGKKEHVVDTEGDIALGGSVNYSTGDGKHKYTYVFQDIKDIEKIDSIEFNDKEYHN